jgi:bifunctional non-homologous end joining protein LigD
MAGKAMTQARFIPPMKALNLGQVPGGRWTCEIKFDGYRAVAVLNGGRASLWSRNQKDMSGDYPEVIEALGRLKCRNAVLDGEVVALDSRGRSRFQLLQNRGAAADRATLVYYVFDLMHLDGDPTLDEPLAARRRLLQSLLRRVPKAVQVSPAFDTEPAKLLAAARKQGLEGIIAKKPDSRYEADRRSGAWVKCKVLAEQEFVIGGFTLPKNSREHFGAILVGYHEKGRLLYAGKVGTGFDRKSLASLHARFLRATAKACPFKNLPMPGKPRFGAGMGRSAMSSVTWLRPELVAQVKFAEWTDEGLLRQPVFLGLRRDKAAKDVEREPGTAEPRPNGRGSATGRRCRLRFSPSSAG